MPITEMIMPTIRVTSSIIVKYCFAFSGRFSPSVFDTSALPPVPNINPTPPNIITNGIIKFIAAKGVFPTKFETNSPSTTQ